MRRDKGGPPITLMESCGHIDGITDIDANTVSQAQTKTAWCRSSVEVSKLTSWKQPTQARKWAGVGENRGCVMGTKHSC